MYLHTPSLHDSLPIWRGNARGIRPSGPAGPGRRHRDAAARPTRGAPRRLCGGITVVPQGAGRSEEQTSELQSLMRISYAVFCMKKKKIHTTQTQKIESEYNRPVNEKTAQYSRK